MRGASLKAIQELLGHATIEMTMRYAHLAPHVAQQAVRLLDGGHCTHVASGADSLGSPSQLEAIAK
jgi:Phage integrase family